VKPLLDEALERYIYEVLPERDVVLSEMEREAKKRDIPIVGPAVGMLLFQLAVISGAKRVCELGSAIGYSTIWWARAVGESGRVIYTDSSEKNAAEAKGYFERAGVAERVQMEVGDALEVLSEQDEAFDIIFNDVDKEDYPRVLRAAIPKLKRGGLFVTDNVLWSGRVAQPNPDERTLAILEFNRMMYASEELFTTILPLRDGVAVAVKR